MHPLQTEIEQLIPPNSFQMGIYKVTVCGIEPHLYFVGERFTYQLNLLNINFPLP